MRREQILPPRYVHALPREQALVGREAELRLLASRASSEEGGVIALIGLGGAGKTVLLHQALERLQAAAAPRGLFAWSFYRDSDADSFLGEALRYFTGRAPAAEGSLGRVYELCAVLKDFGPAVLGLDGLERVQAFGADSAGRIEDPALRVLLERLAVGVGSVLTLVTTRVALSDLSEHKGAGYQEIALDALPTDAAAALLRDRGTDGTDAELASLSAAYDGHALTLSLVGRLVAEYHGAAAGRGPEIAPYAELGALDASRRLDRVLQAFERKLPPTEITVLERMAAFRGDTTADLVGAVLLDRGRGGLVDRVKSWWSDPLGRIDAAGLLAALDHLESLKVLAREGERDGKTLYAFHAAVKDHFYERLLSVGQGEKIHETMRHHLAARPMQRKPETEEELDRMEELIHHTLACERVEEAFRLYWDRMDGYDHVGRALGHYARGRRIVAAFFTEGNPEKPREGTGAHAAMLAGDLGLYLEKLGELDRALECHHVAAAALRDTKDSTNLCIGLRNEAGILLLQGQLVEARRRAGRALSHAENAGDEEQRIDTLTLIGLVDGLHGKIPLATSAFADARAAQGKLDRHPGPLTRRRGVRHARLMLRTNDLPGARGVLDANIDLCRRHSWSQDLALSQIGLAEVRRASGDTGGAAKCLEEAMLFALRTGNQEALCMCHLEQGRLHRATGDTERAVEQLAEGLRVARRVGFGIFLIDLLLLAGELQRDAGDPRAADTAKEAHALALDAGCGYVWGQVGALDLLARASEAAGNTSEARDAREAEGRLRGRLGRLSGGASA